MSLILDALKKADQERRTQQGVPGLDASHPQEQASFPWGGLVLVAVVVAAITAGGVWWWLRPAAAPEPAAQSRPVMSESSSSVSPAASSVSVSRASSSSARQTEREEVANLYRQRQQGEADQASSAVTSQARVSPDLVEESASSAPAAQASLADFDHVGGVRDLPPSVQNSVPTLMYAGHDYSPDGASRVIINDEPLEEGQRLSNGIRVKAIVSDGVVLVTDSHLFKLEALSSWVNM